MAYVPSTEEFTPIVLEILSGGEAHRRSDICEEAGDRANVSAEARLIRHSSGPLLYLNRASWACSHLYKAGLIERVSRGVYRITDEGREVAARKLTSYSTTEMMEWDTYREYQEELKQRRIAQGEEDSPVASEEAPTSEHDNEADAEAQIDLQAHRYNAAIETELRHRLQQASPAFFERAVIELLWAMGYGGTHGEREHLGRSHDGGIDGIIRQDPLGLSNVYIQAKRYADTNRVGDVEIRNFIGSLAALGASHGVFITTSTFLPRATATAENYPHGKVVLIDGIRLTRLMLEYGVAVQPRKQVTLYEVDEDFFEADN